MTEDILPDDWARGPFFEVSLLKLLDKEPCEDFIINCTHITKEYWVFEGDEAFLGGNFEIIKVGAVPCLGDFNEDQLIELVDKCFSIDLLKEQP